MAHITLDRILSALFQVFTHPITLLAFCSLGIYAIYVLFVTSTRSTSVDVTIRSFYTLMKRENWSHLWSHLSLNLRFLLSDREREALARRGQPGIEQLKYLASVYEHLFRESRPQVISKHKVPEAREGAEMIMVHTRHQPSGHGVTFWLVRKIHSKGFWMIEEVLIHPTPQTPPYMLTGKRFIAPRKVETTATESLPEVNAEQTATPNGAPRKDLKPLKQPLPLTPSIA